MPRKTPPRRPTQSQAEDAVRVLLGWIGDDPGRPALRKTPTRVVGALKDWHKGYELDPYEILGGSFHAVGDFDRIVTLCNIDFESHCEHHMAPMIGTIHLAYLPRKRLAGISKLVRAVEAFTRRLQVQERLTGEIARCMNDVLQPRGVAVIVEAQHHCMTTRGVHRSNVRMVTNEMLGEFRSDDRIRGEFFAAVHSERGR